MTTIRVNCPECHENIDLEPHDLVIIDNRTMYVFHCPNCDDKVAKRADKKVLALLLSVGVAVYEAPPVDPQDKYDVNAPRFTSDDLIAFHFTLEDEEAIAAWLAK
jgi:predicted RNA-binding Zn-ribbon protein involved in translation (DUF1610 family)